MISKQAFWLLIALTTVLGIATVLVTAKAGEHPNRQIVIEGDVPDFNFNKGAVIKQFDQSENINVNTGRSGSTDYVPDIQSNAVPGYSCTGAAAGAGGGWVGGAFSISRTKEDIECTKRETIKMLTACAGDPTFTVDQRTTCRTKAFDILMNQREVKATEDNSVPLIPERKGLSY